MNEFTRDINLTSASIVTSSSAIYQIARDMNEFTQEKNLTSASIVISCLASQQVARYMSNVISARAVASGLAS